MVNPGPEREPVVRFAYEHTVEWTEEEYARLRHIPPMTRRGKAKLAALIGVGLAALAWRWTAPIGIVLILVALLFWFMPRMGRSGVRQEFANARYLRGPVTYGVHSDGVWIRGAGLRAESAWSGLSVWDEIDGWLLLAASGMPPVYLPEEGLRAAGLHQAVLALAQEHGVEYDAVERAKQRAASRLTTR